jgi:hypothetical protein
MRSKVIVIVSVLIVLIGFAVAIRGTIYPSEVPVLSDGAIPNELDLSSMDLGIFENKELITKLHNSIYNIKGTRVSGANINGNSELLYLDYGYKGQTLYFSKYGEIYYLVRKADIVKENIFNKILYKIDSIYSNSNFVTYKTGKDKDKMFIFGSILKEARKNAVVLSEPTGTEKILLGQAPGGTATDPVAPILDKTSKNPEGVEQAKITVNSKINNYALYMSSVIGLPLEIKCNEFTEMEDYSLEIKCEEGNISWLDDGILQLTKVDDESSRYRQEVELEVEDVEIYWTPIGIFDKKEKEVKIEFIVRNLENKDIVYSIAGRLVTNDGINWSYN